MSSFSKLGIIIITLLFSLLFLLASVIIYAVYLRLRRRSSTITPSDGHRCSSHADHYCLSNKDLLLYLLCWKKRTQVEPSGARATGFRRGSSSSIEALELMKVEGISKSSRVLFTIEEEERVDEVLAAGSTSPSSEIYSSSSSSSMGQRVVVAEEGYRCCDETTTIQVVEGLEGFQTPFESSSPVGSPPYYTPPPSPCRLSNI